MVKHILFVKMKDNSIEQCEKVKVLFLSMKEQIPFLREVQVGIDYLHSQRSYDVVLELVVDVVKHHTIVWLHNYLVRI